MSPEKQEIQDSKVILDMEEKQRLNIFLNSMKEHQSKKMKLYSKVQKTMDKLFQHYKALSQTIFTLADLVGDLTTNSQKIEKLCSGNFKNIPLHSNTFNTFKVALYSWSHEMSQTQANFKKNFEPLITNLQTGGYTVKNVI